MLPVQLPDAERNTDLRVKAFRASDNMMFFVQQLIKPLLHNGFTIASCNANNRISEVTTVKRCQLLKCPETILHLDDVAANELPQFYFARADNKIPDSFFIGIADVPVTIIMASLQSEKNRVNGLLQPAAVIYKVRYNAVLRFLQKAPAYNFTYDGDGIQF